MIRLPRRGRVAAPSVAAGILLALSLPPFGWWPLGPLGAAVLYWRLGGLGLRARVWSGWLAGLGCDVIGLAWARAFNWYGAVVLVVVEALFFAAAAALTPPRRGRVPAFVGACTLAEALRMTWPFGGLPLGGVFLGQAHGPLVQLARLGGPLLITAGVWATGVAVATLASWAWARRRGAGGPSLVGVAVVTGGRGADRRRRAGPRWGRSRPHAAGGPGPGRRAAGAQQGAGLADDRLRGPGGGDRRRQRRAAPAPGLVLWPEDVVALDRPLAGSPEEELLTGWPAARHDARRRGHRAGVATTFRNEVVAWGPDGQIVGVFEKVHRVPFGEYVPFRSFFSHLADLSGVPTDAVPGHGTGLHAHAGRTARPPRVLRGLLRRAEPRVRAGRRRAARGPHQHVLVRHVAGAGAGDRGGGGAGRRDRSRPRPGGADRLQRRDHRPRGRGLRAARSGAARCCWPPPPSVVA